MLQRLGCTYAILRSLQQHFADEAPGCWTNLLQLLSNAARVLATHLTSLHVHRKQLLFNNSHSSTKCSSHLRCKSCKGDPQLAAYTTAELMCLCCEHDSSCGAVEKELKRMNVWSNTLSELRQLNDRVRYDRLSGPSSIIFWQIPQETHKHQACTTGCDVMIAC